uniref:ETS domain-containing protein n=1 Tax=Ornithorhynchus anatinus TaxID=9258 RepID=F6UYY9_ORNAN
MGDRRRRDPAPLRSHWHQKPSLIHWNQMDWMGSGRKWTQVPPIPAKVGAPDSPLLHLLLQNIIRKVSGQKFVYKFVSYPEGAGSGEEGRRPEAPAEPPKLPPAPGLLPKTPRGGGGGAPPRSSRNEYMRSGLYSTFTIQSLQAPALRPARLEAPPPSDFPGSELPPPPLDISLETAEAAVPLQVILAPTEVKVQGSEEEVEAERQPFLPEVKVEFPEEEEEEEEEEEDRGGGGEAPRDEANPEPDGPPAKPDVPPSEKELLEMVAMETVEAELALGLAGAGAGTVAGLGAQEKEQVRAAEGPQPQKSRKPKDLELPFTPSLLAGPAPDRAPGPPSGLLAPGGTSTSLTPSVITSHALTPVLLTPSSLPPTIHFWSTLSPIAPRSPAKLSFQFPTSSSSQVHIPSLSVDGLSTPVVLSPGPQKP